ncbi:MAG: hypothetical protein AABY06_02470 [Nanoarchaeota archaeon]
MGREKGLLKKLKLGLASAGLITLGLTAGFFNVNAQENYKPKYNTRTHEMLMIEDSVDNISFNTSPSLKTLDALIDNSKNYIIKKEKYSIEEIKLISQKIFSEIKSVSKKIRNNKSIDYSFENSLIYSAIGEANSLNFDIIITPEFPENTFIEYNQNDKEKENISININLINGGIILHKNFFFGEMENKKIKELENSIYFRNLNEKELISINFLKKAKESFEKEKKCESKDFDKTLLYCDKALETNPKLIEAWKIKYEIYRNLVEKEKFSEAYRSIEKLENLELYLSKYNTTAHIMLEMEDSINDGPPYPRLKTLDELIENSKNYILKKDPKTYAKEEIAELSKNVYERIMEKLPDIKERDDLCYKMSLIYFAIGEANGIPFYVSLLPRVPGHVFVRYDPDGKHDPLNQGNPANKEDINIETTTGEIQNTEKGEYSDEYFIHKKCLSKKELEKKPWLKNLTEKELFGLAYLMRTDYYGDTEFDKKFEDCKKSISLFPNCFMTYLTTARTLEKLEYWGKLNSGPLKDEKPAFYYEKSLELSQEPETYIELAGYHLHRKKDNKKTIENCTKAVDLIYERINLECEPKKSGNLLFSAYAKRRFAYENLGNFEKAKNNYLKSIELFYPWIFLSKKDLNFFEKKFEEEKAKKKIEK